MMGNINHDDASEASHAQKNIRKDLIRDRTSTNFLDLELALFPYGARK
jgi:hypothetical protein